MKNKPQNVITYLFRCPPPCDREVMVEAKNKRDAIDKMIMAGAMSCRNSEDQRICEKAHVDMPSMPVERLKNIVALYMRE